ncbi:MAG TPA: hypothetical protein VHV55_00865 [Pirellulales bacterium]|jgi:hypothetical protein|nr:hypothetical protein [Pirellulales bacterium]
MTSKDLELEKLVHPDLLPNSEPNPLRPRGHDAILDLIASQPPEMPNPLAAGSSDARNHAADVFISAEPPAIFGPGNTGIMSPDPAFPSSPPNIPAPLQNLRPANPPTPNAGTSPSAAPLIPEPNENPTTPLSSLPALDFTLLSTLPFLPPPGDSVPATDGPSARSSPSPLSPLPSFPNSVRDILPLLPDAAPDPSADDAVYCRQSHGAAADPPRSGCAAFGSTGNEKITCRSARPLPEFTVTLGGGHVMAKRVLLAMEPRLEEIAREECKNQIHRAFSVFRAEMRARFR